MRQSRIRRIGFVSTRISGSDGVSLEIGKWTDMLEGLGFECCFLSGKTDRAENQSAVIEEADFQHPMIEEINADCFGRQSRSREMSTLIRMTAASIKNELYEAVGVLKPDLIILQPTRIVPRKGIEHTIELVRRLDDPRCKLVISHEENDEGPEYPQRIRDYAQLLGVDVTFAAGCIGHCRERTETPTSCYSIWDAYRAADLVAYPSTYEGFGNAFLEAVYFRKPVFCNRYAIFRTDIEPCGFRTISMDGFLTESVVEDVRRVLKDADYRQQMVDHNFEVGRRFFSYRRVEEQLHSMLNKPR